MIKSDKLFDFILIEDNLIKTFTDLHTFVRTKFPEKLAVFERNYSKMLIIRNLLTFLEKASDLDPLSDLPFDDEDMKAFKNQHGCNIAGAWLMLSLQQEISDRDEVRDGEFIVSSLSF
jgi:hypothetical protein